MARKLRSRYALPAHSVMDSHARTALLVKFKRCQGKKIVRRALKGNIKTIRGVRCAKIANKDTLNSSVASEGCKECETERYIGLENATRCNACPKGKRPLLAENTVKFAAR